MIEQWEKNIGVNVACVEENSQSRKEQPTKEYVINAERHKKMNVRNKKHDCPYQKYGEPCQCNIDWLEILIKNKIDKDKSMWDMSDEEKEKVREVREQIFFEFQRQANEKGWIGIDIYQPYGEKEKLTSKAEKLKNELINTASQITNIQTHTLADDYRTGGVNAHIREYYKPIFESEYKEQNNIPKNKLIVKELLSRIGITNSWYSMPCGESRIIKYHHYTPVIAYATIPVANYGVFIIKTKIKYMSHKAWKKDVYNFSVSRITEEEALKQINAIKSGNIEIQELSKEHAENIRNEILMSKI